MNVTELDFTKIKVLVIGDVMLDQYWFGTTKRISPEAPVPVVHIGTEEYRPGGAGNVALNIAALGGNSTIMGIIGADSAANILQQQLQANAVNCALIVSLNNPTISKLRVLSDNQQLIRLDKEQNFTADQVAQQALQQQLVAQITEHNVLIISDYNKGSIRDINAVIAIARENNILVLLDPKHHDAAYCAGASVITPNFKEFQTMVGECATPEIMVQQAQVLIKAHNIANIVITRGAEGMTVVSATGAVAHIATEAHEVFDVTGAGDTVIAVIALGLARGMDIIKAAELANIAAGIVVSKVGTATASITELLEAAYNKYHDYSAGITDATGLQQLLHAAKVKGETIVFTNGCFDILHPGHVKYLEQAKALGTRLIIGVNDDASVVKLKGPTRPINTLEDRMIVLAGLKSVDWVVPFSEDTPENLIKMVRPDVLVKGGDYSDVTQIVGADYVLSYDGIVRVLDLSAGKSTSNTINSVLATSK